MDGDQDTTLREIIAWLTGAGGIIAAAAAWGVKYWGVFWRWRVKVRQTRRKEKDEDVEEIGIPWKRAWAEQSKALQKAIEGMAKLTTECSEWKVKAAKLESDSRHLERDNERLNRDNERLNSELSEAREQERKLWELVRHPNESSEQEERPEETS